MNIFGFSILIFTMSRRKIAAGNWKMNLNLDDASALVNQIVRSYRDNKVFTYLGVPFPYLLEMSRLTTYIENVDVIAQDCSHFENGAHTGEVSASMIAAMGISTVIIGHSERRADNHETNDILKQKVNLALANGLKIIFCCGESLKTRKAKKHVSFVKNQIKESLFHLKKKDFDNIIIAYEPIWAIGTGETASPAQAQEMHREIRKYLQTKIQRKASEVSILYGGSVKPANARELFGQKDIDGGLVGGASLKAETFVPIINSF